MVKFREAIPRDRKWDRGRVAKALRAARNALRKARAGMSTPFPAMSTPWAVIVHCAETQLRLMARQSRSTASRRDLLILAMRMRRVMG